MVGYTVERAMKWDEPPTRDEVLDLLKDGTVVGIWFWKRDGTLRKMSARGGVYSYMRGGKKPFSDAEKGLVTVFDMNKKAYRSFYPSDLVRIQAHGEIMFERTVPVEMEVERPNES